MALRAVYSSIQKVIAGCPLLYSPILRFIPEPAILLSAYFAARL
jgi:hypothetical protein